MNLRRLTATMLLMAAALWGCSLVPGASPNPTSCNGITSEVGGCDPGLPTFAGTTCEAIADEYGAAIDTATVAVINGPRELEGERQSVRLTDAAFLITNLATNRMIELDLLEDCTMPAFLDRASTKFSETHTAQVGTVMADNDPPVTYDDWLTFLTQTLSALGSRP